MIELSTIRDAIEQREISRAREMLRTALLEDPTSETYFLAAQVAANEIQKERFLLKALDLDPFNGEADTALDQLKARTSQPAAPSNSFVNGSLYQPHTQPNGHSTQQYRARVQQLRGQGLPLPGRSTRQHDERPRAEAYPLASLWSRLFAVVIDIVVILIIQFVFGFVVGILMVIFGMDPNTMSEQQAASVDGFLSIVSLVIIAAYPAYFLSTQDGQTPGKRMMGIRIVRIDDKPLGIDDALVRNVLGYLLSTLFVLLGHLAATVSPRKQTWHDKFVHTVVIKEG